MLLLVWEKKEDSEEDSNNMDTEDDGGEDVGEPCEWLLHPVSASQFKSAAGSHPRFWQKVVNIIYR